MIFKRSLQLLIVFFLLGFLIGYISCNPGKKIKKEKFNFELYDYEGNVYTPESLKGQVVWMTLWTTTCPYCLRLNQQISRMKSQYEGKIFFLGVALASNGWQEVIPYLEENDIDYTVVLGNRDLVKELGGIRGVPANFIFSKEGKLMMRFEGYLPRLEMERIIKKVLTSN